MKRVIKSSNDLILDYSNENNIRYAYKLEDTYGAPQAGVDVEYFATYEDLENYLEENPDVEDRIYEGYAIIKEC